MVKQYIVVAYDIVDDNRRNKIADILSAYGQRVNKSVFECFLRQKDISELKRKIRAHVKKDEDIVLYYFTIAFAGNASKKLTGQAQFLNKNR